MSLLSAEAMIELVDATLCVLLDALWDEDDDEEKGEQDEGLSIYLRG